MSRRWDSLLPGTIVALTVSPGADPKIGIVLSNVIEDIGPDGWHQGYMLWESWNPGSTVFIVNHPSKNATLPDFWSIVHEPK